MNSECSVDNQQKTGRVHSRTKTKEKATQRVYVCPFEECKKCFTESGNLKTHIRIHVIYKQILTLFIDWRKAVCLRTCWLRKSFHYQSSSKLSLSHAHWRETVRLSNVRQMLFQSWTVEHPRTNTRIQRFSYS